MAISKDRVEDLVAEHVLAFDASPDGTIVFTDSRRIFARSIDGRVRTIAEGGLIEKVTAL